MLNKKSLINLFLLFNLAMSIKTNNFCFIKQKECKGYYKQHYQIKCELIKCHGTFKHECGSTNICSDSITECSEYCTSDSLACDYFKSNENKKYFQNIPQCNHHDFSTLKTNHKFW